MVFIAFHMACVTEHVRPLALTVLDTSKADCFDTAGGSPGSAHRVEGGGDEDVDARQQLVEVCTRSAA